MWYILLCYLEYKWKIHLIFFIIEVHTSDGHDNRSVTRKLHVVGTLINTSDVQICSACRCYTYTSDGQSARH
jgi:hypothetical protein